jgi:hypothetical protein
MDKTMAPLGVIMVNRVIGFLPNATLKSLFWNAALFGSLCLSGRLHKAAF